ncbi:hypothetical protein ACFFQW_39380 [Umezawaea endophytica]|uniref:Uncharacterized protein n=1 Tax=Umezawaea endophytica TaxID=1654476 RepID=A0A9X3A2V3_9PSEU|nr:hypothetical protein [Umezawaea endophytica]MCS7479503.1 hypothetical protein [Umezawaea endophytica]
MSEKIPVVSTAESTTQGVAGKPAPRTKEVEEFRGGLPSPERLAEAVLADLERDLRDLLATDPDLVGVTKAEVAAWLATDVKRAFTAVAEHGWEQS